MPFTPFHLGPGLLVKVAFRRGFSFTAFALAQVVIDLETLFFLLQGAPWVHRGLHTFVGGGLAGLAVALGVVVGGGRLRALPGLWAEVARVEVAPGPALAGGLVGGLSHALLDALMHRDMHPLRPFAEGNPLLGRLELPALHLGCVLSGALALVVLAVGGATRKN